jgi:hypothetical protein
VTFWKARAAALYFYPNHVFRDITAIFLASPATSSTALSCGLAASLCADAMHGAVVKLLGSWAISFVAGSQHDEHDRQEDRRAVHGRHAERR